MGKWKFSCISALDRDEWSASRLGRFTSEEIGPGTHWIGGLVGLTGGLDVVEKRKLTPAGIRKPAVQPVTRGCTD
jgi:hypothetical protein